MSVSPAKGETVMVLGPKTGKLLLKPPSISLAPWNL
jgi:hypothetical protein